MKRRLLRKILANPIDSKGRTVYAAEIRHRGRYVTRRQVCRLDDFDYDDPIMQESGCMGDFLDDFARRDRAEGCPACLGGYR
jgi:hypothetical protein